MFEGIEKPTPSLPPDCESNHGIHADDLASDIDQRSTGVAGIDGRVGLQIDHRSGAVELALRRADDAQGHSVFKAERAAEGQSKLADMHLIGVRQFERRQVGGLHLEQSKIGQRMSRPRTLGVKRWAFQCRQPAGCDGGKPGPRRRSRARRHGRWSGCIPWDRRRCRSRLPAPLQYKFVCRVLGSCTVVRPVTSMVTTAGPTRSASACRSSSSANRPCCPRASEQRPAPPERQPARVQTPRPRPSRGQESRKTSEQRNGRTATSLSNAR
jgi:hypothetical protein